MMDVLVEQDETAVMLSDLGLFTVAVTVGATSYEGNQTRIPGRNGQVDLGGTHVAKAIQLHLRYCAADQEADTRLRDRLFALFAQTRPIYVTEYVDVTDTVLFERPGMRSSNHQRVVADNKRYCVVPGDGLELAFLGKSEQGLLTDVLVSLVTAELPYGESRPENERLTRASAIRYSGTVVCSQLECPFALEVVALAAAQQLTVTVGDVQWRYTGAVKVGDVFVLKGVSNERNGLNINHLTNYAYFRLSPSPTERVYFNCSLAAEVTLQHKKHLYV